MNSNDEIRELLVNIKTIGVVWLSSNPMRPSFGVSQYMLRHGYRIIPVNPNEQMVLGQKAYARLTEVPEKIDLGELFLRPEFVPEIIDELLRLKIRAVLLQEGVVHQSAAEKARD